VTVQVAQRAVIDLGARTSVLEAMDRVRGAGSEEIVLSIAAGAPVLRSPVFLEVLRRASGTRRIALVTPDARARSLATAVHMPAFASLAALERHELDATEELGPARRAAIVAAQPKTRTRSPLRALAVFASLVTAAAVLFAVVGPTATVVVVPVSQALGPLEYDLRAGPNNADINALTRRADVTAKYTGTATGSREEKIAATGTARFMNQTTNAVRIPKSTTVSTRDGIFFQTTEEKTLPASSFTIFPPSVTPGTIDIPIIAVEPGPRGNVAARTITVSPNPSQYAVDNAQATSGGETKNIPIVQRQDYDAAAARAEAELRKQGEGQLTAWKNDAAKNKKAVFGLFVKTSSVSGPEVVGKELKPGEPSFEMQAAGTIFAYEVAEGEPNATAVKRLGQDAEIGFEIDPASAAIEPIVGPTVLEDGVHWRVRVRGSQSRILNSDAIRASVAGRDFSEVEGAVNQHGVHLLRVLIWPGQWPRLPVLDSRIKIQKDAAASP